MRYELAGDVDRLLESQTRAWPLLAAGVRGLRESRSRTERAGRREIVVRHIPHRIKSTTARVDSASIAERPCFLCPAGLAPEQEGIRFDDEFTIYCNPYPILEKHLTIIHAEHRPQRIAGRIPSMLRLARALPDSFVIYNGPECGASAPDHLHFQACSRRLFPIAADIVDAGAPQIEDYVPRVLVFGAPDEAAAAGRVEKALELIEEVLGPRAGNAAEPMVNIACFFERGEWRVLVFPRSRHRPHAYETGDLLVSPATIDLCGVLVAPRLQDFERICGADIEEIFNEVSIPAEAFDALLSRIEARR